MKKSKLLSYLSVGALCLTVACGKDKLTPAQDVASQDQQQTSVDSSSISPALVATTAANTPSGLQNDEELVITFEGMTRGYLEDQNVFDSNNGPDFYMQSYVGIANPIYKVFPDSTKSQHTPADESPETFIAFTENNQIVMDGQDLNTKIANSSSQSSKDAVQILIKQDYGVFATTVKKLFSKTITFDELKVIAATVGKKETFPIVHESSTAQAQVSIEIRKKAKPTVAVGTSQGSGNDDYSYENIGFLPVQ